MNLHYFMISGYVTGITKKNNSQKRLVQTVVQTEHKKINAVGAMQLCTELTNKAIAEYEFKEVTGVVLISISYLGDFEEGEFEAGAKEYLGEVTEQSKE